MDAATRSWLDDDLYPRLSHPLVFGRLDGFRQVSPERWLARCPSGRHADRHPSFSMHARYPAGKCFSCGYTATWLQWAEREHGRGRPAIEALARLAGIAPPPAAPMPDRGDPRDADDALAADRILAAAKATLWRPEGGDVLAYLRARGYADDLLRSDGLGLGAWPPSREDSADGWPQPTVLARLVPMAPVPTPAHRLLVAMRDTEDQGRIRAFALRTIDDAALAAARAGRGRPVLKYLYPQGFSRRGFLPGLGRAVALASAPTAGGAGFSPVVLVEGVIDAEVLATRGLPVAALGGSILPPDGVETLRAARVRSVVLALDDDAPGRDAADTIADALLRAGLRCYVAGPFDGAKDPDELARCPGGLDRLRNILATAPAAERWLVHRTATTAPGTDLGRDEALSRILRRIARWPADTHGRSAEALAAEFALDADDAARRIRAAAALATEGPRPEPVLAPLALRARSFIAQIEAVAADPGRRRWVLSAIGAMLRMGIPEGQVVSMAAAAIIEGRGYLSDPAKYRAAIAEARGLVRYILAHPR